MDKFSGWPRATRWEVVEYEPPHALACRALDGISPALTRYTLKAANGATILSVQADLESEGILRAFPGAGEGCDPAAGVGTGRATGSAGGRGARGNEQEHLRSIG